jgi:hypothetical protein
MRKRERIEETIREEERAQMLRKGPENNIGHCTEYISKRIWKLGFHLFWS